MDTILQDIRVGVRSLGRQKTMTVTVMLTLGVCLAASTAIFCILNAIVLRPLPFHDPDRIAYIYNTYPRAGVPFGGASAPDYFDRRELTRLFEEVAIFRTRTQTVGATGAAERVQMMTMTPSLFRLLNVSPAIGRAFDERDAVPGDEQKVILSYEAWQRWFGGRRDAIGRDLPINEVPHTIVGIMPAGFRFWSPEIAAWEPAAFTSEQRSDEERYDGSFQMIARVKPGVALDAVRREILVLNGRVLDRNPAAKPLLASAGYTTFVVPLQAFLVRDIRSVLYLLWGGSLLVLLIGCLNIANLTLLRAAGRMKEFATRHALGATVRRLARQMITETMLLALVGGAAGLVLGTWMLSIIRTWGFDRLPRAFEIRMDWTAAAYALAVSAVIGVLIGLAPVASMRQRAFAQAVRDEGRGGTASRRTRLVRRTLVTAQVALALVLLAGSSLLFASFRQLLAVDPGFRAENVWTGMVSLPGTRYGDDQRVFAFASRLLEHVRAIPGVTAAGITDVIPLGPTFSDSVVFAEGYQPKAGESMISAFRVSVTPGYLETMGIRRLRGRLFDEHDTAASLRVIVIDERMASRFWPGADPIGRRMYYPDDSRHLTPTPKTRFLTVVGVVNAVRLRSMAGENERPGTIYTPMTQNPRGNIALAARSGVETGTLTAAIRSELRRLDPQLPLFNVRSMTERRDLSVENRRTPLLLAVVFGVLALFLAMVGIYGVLAYQVAQRRREIGIRMALGGNAGRIFRLVLAEGIVMVGAGALVGLMGTLAIGRLIESQLYGIRPTDPLVIALAGAVVAVVALLACLVPARRAACTDPVRALNEL